MSSGHAGAVQPRAAPVAPGLAHRYFVVIVNFIPPYSFEVAGILAGPVGAVTRFRYQAKYISTVPEVSDLQDHELLICLRNRDTGRIIPLRFASASLVYKRAEVTLVEARLQSTVNLSTVETDRNRQLQEFQNAIETEIQGFDNTPNTDLRKLIFWESGALRALTSSWQDDAIGEDQRWSACIGAIESLFTAVGLDFFKVASVVDDSGRALSMTSRAGRWAYELEPNEEYTVELIQKTFTGKTGDSSLDKARTIELVTSTTDIVCLEPKLPILGKYSIMEVRFSVSPTARNGLRRPRILVSGESLPNPYGTELPVRIRRPRYVFLIRMLALLIFVLAAITYVVPEVLVTILNVLGSAVSFGPPPTPESIEKASVILMVISASATGATSLIANRVQIGP